MSGSATAEIIPFPGSANSSTTANPPSPAAGTGRALVASGQSAAPTIQTIVATSPPVPEPAEARLARALAGLNNAVTTQRAAMAAWKSALGDLRTVTGRLGASLRTYNDSLGHLDARVNTLRAEAVKLEAWADDALTKKG